MATSEIPSAAANSSGMSDSGTDGRAGSGNPCGSTPITSTPRDARSSSDRQGDRDHDGDEDAGRPRRDPLEAQDDAEAEQPDAERPRVRLVEARRNATASATSPLASVLKPNSLGSWPMKIDDRETGQVAGPDRVREQVGDEAELGDARADRDQPDEEAEHPGQGDRLLLAPGGKGQDRRGDHRAERGIRAKDEDRRRSDEGVGDQAHDGRVEAGDRAAGRRAPRRPCPAERGA